MVYLQKLIMFAPCFYFLGFLSSLWTEDRLKAVLLFLVPAAGINAFVVIYRYWHIFPMMPMYMASSVLPLCLGLIYILFYRYMEKPEGRSARRFILFFAFAVSALTSLFPKDFYIPFIKSAVIFSHLFLVFGIVGKGCFLVSTAWSASGFFHACFPRTADPEKHMFQSEKPAIKWAIWGFAFFTVSMFSGELWSCLVWGTPVVWDDPAITCVMAVWFFYVGMLHLAGVWSLKARTIYAVFGGTAVNFFNIIPDTGPIRWPF